MCGHEYLIARGKCSRATLYRRLKALTDAKLLTVVRRSAPGVRAIYEIEVIHRLPETGLTDAETRSGLTSAETRVIHNGSQSEPNGSQNEPERVSPLVKPTPSLLPRHNTPSTTDRPVITPSLEVRKLSTGQEQQHASQIELAARQAVDARRAAKGNT